MPDHKDDGEQTANMDPFAIFSDWFALAQRSEINDPEAMSLATLDEENRPDVRMVLLKGANAEGFVFYTSLHSQKGRLLAALPEAALCLHWKSLRRQVRIRGSIETVSESQADAYFASRSRNSRIGSWASRQSQPLRHRSELKARFCEFQKKFEGAEPPRPDHWCGYRLVPNQIEFWRDGDFRLHERILFTCQGCSWNRQYLYP